jgi:hypothetical protein
MVVSRDPVSHASLGLGPGFSCVEIDAFILQRPPEALDEPVVEIAGFAVHRHLGLCPFQPVGPVEGSELTAWVDVNDFNMF